MSERSRFPSIESLLAFEAVVRLGSFEAAARELSVTSSAIGKRITLLERTLGEPLFDRSSRERQLTAAGTAYIESVRSILAQLSAVSLHRRAVQRRPRLRVVTPPTFAREILVPSLAAFRLDPARIDLEIVVAIPYLDATTPEADVRVSFGPVAAGAMAEIASVRSALGVPLLVEPVFVVGQPAFIRRHRLARPEDVRRAPLIRCPIEPWRNWSLAAGLGDFEPLSGPRLVDLGLALEAAACGQGLALARAAIARRWIEAGHLVDLFPGLRADAGTGYRLEVLRPSAEALAFAQTLRTLCAAMSESTSSSASRGTRRTARRARSEKFSG